SAPKKVALKKSFEPKKPYPTLPDVCFTEMKGYESKRLMISMDFWAFEGIKKALNLRATSVPHFQLSFKRCKRRRVFGIRNRLKYALKHKCILCLKK
ncbi:MAG: hypothetical protein LBP98_10335, partial [Tannerella sp.]|nr:hypothetical protein [Tannerella sp.]